MEVQVFYSHLEDGRFEIAEEGKGKAKRRLLVVGEQPIEGVVTRTGDDANAEYTPDDVFAVAEAAAEEPVREAFVLEPGSRWLPRADRPVVHGTSSRGKPGSWLFLVPDEDGAF